MSYWQCWQAENLYHHMCERIVLCCSLEQMNVNVVQLRFSSSLLFFIRSLMVFLGNTFLEQLNTEFKKQFSYLQLNTVFSVAAIFCVVVVVLSCISLFDTIALLSELCFIHNSYFSKFTILHAFGFFGLIFLPRPAFKVIIFLALLEGNDKMMFSQLLF